MLNHFSAGQADLQRANQKADRLQHLARTMQKENKLLGDEAQLRQQQLEHFRKATQVSTSSRGCAVLIDSSVLQKHL